MIYLIWGAPKRGKTYYATYLAIREMLSKNPKKVFTNYPIIYYKPLNIIQKSYNLLMKINNKLFRNRQKKLIEKNVYSSYKWDEKYIYQGILNSMIILDEAYMFYSSRERNVKADIHSFFATNGHDDNDIMLIAQHYNRIDLVVREMANYYVWVDHVKNLIKNIPFFFKIEIYISEDDFKARRIKNTIYERKRLFFNMNIGNAYDCKFFRKDQADLKPERWVDILQPQRKQNYTPKNTQDDQEKEVIQEWATCGLPR